ncbi:GGDEF domain-containing protein [Actinoplanes sp. CA-030573]|uniref:GGDEF domain-containing protein n=1 Tax=Actinoplanes sp. CA-030573 TaxID=3239898 RepID=UPI003D90A147
MVETPGPDWTAVARNRANEFAPRRPKKGRTLKLCGRVWLVARLAVTAGQKDLDGCAGERGSGVDIQPNIGYLSSCPGGEGKPQPRQPKPPTRKGTAVAFNVLLAAAILLQAATLTAGYAIFVRQRFTIAALLHRSTTDKLTGIPNRDAADNRLSALMSHGMGASIAFIDVDNFKIINDTHGHRAGDAALRYVAARLTEAVEPYMVARYSGDEFLIIIDRTGLFVAQLIARAALRAIDETPFTYANKIIPVNISIGVAVADDIDDPAELLRRADHAMYHAKDNGDMTEVAWMPGMTMPDPSTTGRRTFRDATTR